MNPFKLPLEIQEAKDVRGPLGERIFTIYTAEMQPISRMLTKSQADFLVAAINGFEAAEDKLAKIRKAIERFYDKEKKIILTILNEEQK
jgi:hypothetical protein